MRRARRRLKKRAGAGGRRGRRAGRRRARHPSGGSGSPALDVAAIRAKTGLSQERFAVAFRISPHTLRNWEQGRRRPEGPARALILAIDRDPVALMRALET
jgi:putative transcriptional regulator